MRAEPGVYAIRNADEDVVYAFGVGIYLGDLIPPGDGHSLVEDVDEFKARLREMLEAEDAKDPGWFWAGVEDNGQFKKPLAEIRAEAVAKDIADRQRPMDDRVQERWDDIRRNPCIRLDNGQTVWGRECWWRAGGQEDLERYAATRPIVYVEVSR